MVICRAAALFALLLPAAAAAQDRPLQALKDMSLGGGVTLSLGGELRERFEAVSQPGFGLDGASHEDVLMHRLLLSADLRAGPGFRAFLQLGSWLATERETGAAPTDEDVLDLAQGYLDLSTPLGGGRATLRAGRQEMSFGSSRLVSVRESPNIRRSFDGARAFWGSPALRVDAFAVRPVRLSRDAFDDQSETREGLWGVYGTGPVGLLPGLSADLYYLGLQRDRAVFAQGAEREDRHTLGTRLFGAAAGWDWDVELAGQLGSFGPDRILAWTVATDIGFTFAAAPWRPRLGLKADIASGDGDASDDRLGTFNALYPKVPYFSEAGLVAPANVMDLQPSLTVRPHDSVELFAGWNVLWRHRTEDAFYAPPLSPVDGTVGGDRFIGHQAQLSASWTVMPGVELKAWYVHFFAGSTIAQAGGKDVDYLALSAAFRF